MSYFKCLIVLSILLTLLTIFELFYFEKFLHIFKRAQIAKHPSYSLNEFNISNTCRSLMENKVQEVDRVISFNKYDEHYFQELAHDKKECKNFKSGFPNQNYSREELEFPIAFTFSIHKDIYLFANLLRALYRPTNVYCIHVDLKSSLSFLNSVKELAKCLDPDRIHVLDQSSRVKVVWACHTNFLCHYNCAKFLVNAPSSSVFSNWKYLINMPGQEFPLRTNLEIVRILSSLKGRSLIGGNISHQERFPENGESPFQFKFHWIKGSAYIAGSREFMNFSVKDSKAIRLLEFLVAFNYLHGCRNIDETFYNTLYHNPNIGAPYAVDIQKSRQVDLTIIRVYSAWSFDPIKACGSEKYVRWICIFGEKDLKHLISLPSIGVNKFHQDFEPKALDCLHQWLACKVLREMNFPNSFKIPGRSLESIIDQINNSFKAIDPKFHIN